MVTKSKGEAGAARAGTRKERWDHVSAPGNFRLRSSRASVTSTGSGIELMRTARPTRGSKSSGFIKYMPQIPIMQLKVADNSDKFQAQFRHR
jgi:hypothetical protein